jgi:hypothetical protein
MQLIPGGTGHRPVLGGNLPPSFGTVTAKANGASSMPLKRRASRPPERVSGPFHPDHNRIVPVKSE